jgi:hypothetical protein
MAEYHAEMDNPDARWSCPLCGMSSEWDDDNFDQHMGEETEEDFQDELDFDLEDDDASDDEEESNR